MWERKFGKKFSKKSPLLPPNGVLSICKLPFPNGSYRNGVCRGLWAVSYLAQWNLLSYVANMVSSLVLCTPRQTFFKFLIVIKSCTTRRMAEWFKALCYYHFARYDAGSIPGQGFSAFLYFLQISQTFRGNICFQETIGNTKLFALIVAVLNYL